MAPLPPAPSAPFFPAGDMPVMADFYGWWYLNTLFFQQKVVFRGHQGTTTTSIAADGNPHVIGLDTVDEDTWSGWSSSSHAWTAPISGWYEITVTAYLAALANGVMLVPQVTGALTERLNVTQGATAHAAGAEGQYTAYLIAGQSAVSAAAAILNASAAISTSNTAGQQSTMEIVWLSS